MTFALTSPSAWNALALGICTIWSLTSLGLWSNVIYSEMCLLTTLTKVFPPPFPSSFSVYSLCYIFIAVLTIPEILLFVNCVFTSTRCKRHEKYGVCLFCSPYPKTWHMAGVRECKHEYVLRSLSMMIWRVNYHETIIENSGREKKWFGRKTFQFTVEYNWKGRWRWVIHM